MSKSSFRDIHACFQPPGSTQLGTRATLVDLETLEFICVESPLFLTKAVELNQALLPVSGHFSAFDHIIYSLLKYRMVTHLYRARKPLLKLSRHK